MIRITDLRVKSDLAMKDFAEQRLGISLSTLARIELAEFEGKKHPISRRVATRLTEALKKLLDQEVTVDDLVGVTIAPRRPGRPKRKVASGHLEEVA